MKASARKSARAGTGKKGIVIGSLIATLLVLILYWFMLPALNPSSPALWAFVIVSLLSYLVVLSAVGLGRAFADMGSTVVDVGGTKMNVPNMPHLPKTRFVKVMLLIIGGLIVLAILLSMIGAKIFNASRYRDLLVKTEGSFTEDVAELSMNQIPVVDRDTASRLGSRKLGNMSDLVSQFVIAENYTQINKGNRPVRVTPLVYGDVIKWLNNQKNGVPAYLLVDMVTQETELVRLEKGMKYSPNEYFMRNLRRYLRFHYPTKMFGDYSFEVDENGTPYWIASTICYRIGVWGGKDVEGAVLVNAITGEHKYYDVANIPTWVDQVYHADMILEQLNYNGAFQQGYFNSFIGQRGVLQTTDGYNYIAVNDDVYLYTGMTSAVSDESNIGFVLVNMRTKATKFYSIPGAEEYSAMNSAQGQVQHLGYTSTFPLLLNVAERPTYFMSLKDAAGLVKMYAFVDVERYQLVGTGATVDEARTNYAKVLKQEGEPASGGEPVTGVLAEIYPVVEDGNTRYYFKLEGSDVIYIASIQTSTRLPFLKPGDTLTFTASGEAAVQDVLTIQ